MPQTPPFHFGSPGRKLSDSELAQAIRLDVEAELDAVNLYQSHLEATDNAQARRVLRYVQDDEREHVALFLELIRRLDPKQAEELAGAREKLDRVVRDLSEKE